jgi:hypothetical protein
MRVCVSGKERQRERQCEREGVCVHVCLREIAREREEMERQRKIEEK